MLFKIEMDMPTSCRGCRFCAEDDFGDYCVLLPVRDPFWMPYVNLSVADNTVDERCPFAKEDVIKIPN